MKRQIFFLLLLLSMCVLWSCKEDDYVYPDVITEFVDIRTDDNGRLSSLITDKGEVLQIEERVGLDGLVPDSVYRTVSLYERLTEAKEGIPAVVQLYSSQLAVSVIPMPEAMFFSGVKTDAVTLRSIWRSGNYLNIIALPKVKDKMHVFHFVDNGITSDTNGRRTLTLTLYHDRNGDYEAFTQEAFLSVPLWSYKGYLRSGDRIIFRVNTYEEGMTSREFIY